jgi:hypothetical protein
MLTVLRGGFAVESFHWTLTDREIRRKRRARVAKKVFEEGTILALIAGLLGAFAGVLSAVVSLLTSSTAQNFFAVLTSRTAILYIAAIALGMLVITAFVFVVTHWRKRNENLTRVQSMFVARYHDAIQASQLNPIYSTTVQHD